MPRARVLCVDDEPFIRIMLAETVADLGLHPIEAENGEEALRLAADEPLDLLITDIRLGGIDGWEVAERVRALYPGVPIIYISGFPTQGKSLPGALYLAKPFRPADLEKAICTLLSTPEHA
jgi:CheY-like chemotaxis protein